MKKISWPLFPVLSGMTKPKEQFISVRNVFGTYCGSNKINYLAPKGCWKHRILREKGKVSSEEKILAYFFPVSSNMTNVREQFMRVHKVLRQIVCKWLGHFLGPNRSIETNISKKSSFHVDKSFWLIFPRTIECDKPQGTFHEGSTSYSQHRCITYKSIFKNLRGSWKQKLTRERQLFQWK